jgi:glycosyltransferase involved in cell wall biosynthesis
LGRAIHSVLAQSYTNFELIVVDDGSEDATATAAIDALNGDSRGRVVTLVHSGVSAARNHALAIANGELIAYLDSDNRWHQDYLMEMVARFALPGKNDRILCLQHL